MKKFAPLLAVMFLVLLTVKAFAVSKEANHVNEGETYFEKIGAAGGANTGNPGYLILQGTDNAGNTFNAYFWVDQAGKLVYASYATINGKASFPTGDWRNAATMNATVVGSQS